MLDNVNLTTKTLLLYSSLSEHNLLVLGALPSLHHHGPGAGGVADLLGDPPADPDGHLLVAGLAVLPGHRLALLQRLVGAHLLIEVLMGQKFTVPGEGPY